MKYFIWVVVVIACISAGGSGVGYYMTSKFEEMSGVTVTQFVDGYQACERQAQEPCNMYGGFAPLSQFAK